jgi:hypothetical protein
MTGSKSKMRKVQDLFNSSKASTLKESKVRLTKRLKTGLLMMSQSIFKED